MIINALIYAIAPFWNVIMKIFPSPGFIDMIADSLQKFVNFCTDILGYGLYIFNVPILHLSWKLFTGYCMYLSAEYGGKLLMKYLSRFL